MLVSSQRSEIVQYQHCNRELNRGRNVLQDKHLSILHHRKKKAGGRVGLDPGHIPDSEHRSYNANSSKFSTHDSTKVFQPTTNFRTLQAQKGGERNKQGYSSNKGICKFRPTNTILYRPRHLRLRGVLDGLRWLRLLIDSHGG